MRVFSRLHLPVSRLLLAAVALQISTAFLGLPRPLHWVLGGLVGVLALALLVLVHRLALPRDLRVLSWALVVDLGLQPLLLALGASVSGLRGLHGINGFIVLGLTVLVAIETEETKSLSPASP